MKVTLAGDFGEIIVEGLGISESEAKVNLMNRLYELKVRIKEEIDKLSKDLIDESYRPY
jgi:hypothetical protein